MRLRATLAVCSLFAVFVAALASGGVGLARADVFFDEAVDAAPRDGGAPLTAPADAGPVGPSAESLDAAPSVALLVAPPLMPHADAAAPAPDEPRADVADGGGALRGPTGPDYTGLSIGLRGGFSLPGGQAKSAALGDVVKYVVPVGFDVGYYLRPNLWVGAWFLYGFATTSASSQDACLAGTDTSCTAQAYKFGVAAEYAFRHRRTLSPWVRGGVGIDVLNLRATDSSGSLLESASLFGLEWAVLSAGLDWKPGYFYGIGPYAELALGDYGKSDGLAAPHFYATLGLRARTGLFVP